MTDNRKFAELLLGAMSDIDEKYIEEAGATGKTQRIQYKKILAAVAAFALCVIAVSVTLNGILIKGGIFDGKDDFDAPMSPESNAGSLPNSFLAEGTLSIGGTIPYGQTVNLEDFSIRIQRENDSLTLDVKGLENGEKFALIMFAQIDGSVLICPVGNLPREFYSCQPTEIYSESVAISGGAAIPHEGDFTLVADFGEFIAKCRQIGAECNLLFTDAKSVFEVK